MNEWLRNISEGIRDAWRDKAEEIRDEWTGNPGGCIKVAAIFLVCLAIAAGFIFLLVDSLPRFNSGVVVDKDHDAAHTTYSTTTTRSSSGTTSTHLTPHYHPETWSICVSGFEEDGTPRTEWWSVGAGLYEAIDLGDHVQRVSGTVEVNER